MARVASRSVGWQVPASGSDAGGEEIRVLRYTNHRGEELAGLLDSWGDTRGATAVLIPTGWGQTKEALLPLARTIVATFRAAGRPVSVLRFDGIRQRGESHNDPECAVPGREHHHFTFSQGVEDIEASLDFLEGSPELRPAKTILVTFSAAAIAGRRAVARDEGKRLAGWVCVVGSPDIQSMTRSISGGVDFAAGYEQGMSFGLQELLGLVVDIDRIGVDSAAERMIFLEDARRDMAQIGVPVTWYHGQYDAWMDLRRVRDMLSQGDTRDRRLITIPTGHQVKSSRQAQETFQCVGIDIGRMALGEDLPPAAPGRADLRRRRLAERRRLPTVDVDLHAFWRDYLVGRDQSVGIELMTAASPYRALMRTQIRNLALYPGDRVADLGSGTGSFVRELARFPEAPRALVVDEFDYVREAHERARGRIGSESRAAEVDVSFTLCDLDLRHEHQRIPVRSRSYDAVIGSLVLSYLEQPLLLLREMYRILRPGGRLVVSSMCRDADISKLYVESLAELRDSSALQTIPEVKTSNLETVARSFLNDAARILDLEESGAFHFWDSEELEALVAEAGFRAIVSERGFGDPPQAVVISARRG
jgi:ubiquinone/menaquinone biosynthesis C-methylase UbiE